MRLAVWCFLPSLLPELVEYVTIICVIERCDRYVTDTKWLVEDRLWPDVAALVVTWEAGR